jgi:hypothetical protein
MSKAAIKRWLLYFNTLILKENLLAKNFYSYEKRQQELKKQKKKQEKLKKKQERKKLKDGTDQGAEANPVDDGSI